MEQSRATNCPSVAYQLVGTKKMQQALTKPGVVERYTGASETCFKHETSTTYTQIHKRFNCGCQDKVNLCWALFIGVGELSGS